MFACLDPRESVNITREQQHMGGESLSKFLVSSEDTDPIDRHYLDTIRTPTSTPRTDLIASNEAQEHRFPRAPSMRM